MRSGLFRFSLDHVKTKVLPGKMGLVAQVRHKFYVTSMFLDKCTRLINNNHDNNNEIIQSILQHGYN